MAPLKIVEIDETINDDDDESTYKEDVEEVIENDTNNTNDKEVCDDETDYIVLKTRIASQRTELLEKDITITDKNNEIIVLKFVVFLFEIQYSLVALLRHYCISFVLCTYFVFKFVNLFF